MKPHVFLFAAVAIAPLAGCGGSLSSGSSNYRIGGMVSGLSGSGLVLQDNGGDDLSIGANGKFTFHTPLSSGQVYAVTVFSEPTGPVQRCSIANGSGTATADVANIMVTCATTATAPGEWTWMGGSKAYDQPGVYGTPGAASASNIPGARVWPVNWTDRQGNFWLFGGVGIDSTGALGQLNDLWEYSNGEWTWMAGSNLADQPAVYGTQGQTAPGNTPGARDSAVGWVDSQGNLWLFGGIGPDGNRNDLWKYANGKWTWMAGSNLADQAGIYGLHGQPAPANVPGARFGASGWTDSAGNLWLFGGEGYDSQNDVGILNDLWKYSAGEWSWMGGSNLVNGFGVYGTGGLAAPTNVPGARVWPMSWTDAEGNLWLFGGEGNDVDGVVCQQATELNLNCVLNDLWRYSNGEWTWMGGADTVDEPGFYGREYLAAPGNAPGARQGSVTWTDAQGNIWLFGGSGLDSSISPLGFGDVEGDLNDLWEYSGGEWIWMSGSNQAGDAGNYGVIGVAAATNAPPSRDGAASWTDKSGNLWLFGGGLRKRNDLWVYQPWGPAGPPPPPPPAATYTISGTVYGLAGSGLVLQDNLADNLTVGSDGIFTFNTALAAGENYSISVLTQPSNPQQYCTVVNAAGTATAKVTNVQIMCVTVVGDQNQWTWMGGNAAANYGTLGQAAASNLPPVRQYAANWTDSAGSFWLFGGNAEKECTQLINADGQINCSYFDFGDFWKYSGGEWTWVAGANGYSNKAGVYGMQGQASASNFPGARHGAVTWTDGQGNFWLFGGIGIDSAGKQGDLNDLWEYSNGQWTWVAGSKLIDQTGSYGTPGTPASTNNPGSRDSAMGWTDGQGNLWLFGGWGNDSTNLYCYNNVTRSCLLNDLWKFANGEWTWMGGFNTANHAGVYGALGTAAPNNMPGGRMNAMVSIDATGNVWLFGGWGDDSAGYGPELNDLWKFANGQWTWMSGSKTANQPGAYGILGVPATSNAPGARVLGTAWSDASGNLWLFGGSGFDALSDNGSLNDLWEFSGGQWTWVGGSELAGDAGSYGVLGVPSPSNLPPARYGASGWKESNGSFWLFGGGFNDVWEYQP